MGVPAASSPVCGQQGSAGSAGSGVQHGRLGSMYRPMYFNGGIAVHGSRFDIGAYPSSHGCVRIHNANMDELRGQRLIGLRGTVVVY